MAAASKYLLQICTRPSLRHPNPLWTRLRQPPAVTRPRPGTPLCAPCIRRTGRSWRSRGSGSFVDLGLNAGYQPTVSVGLLALLPGLELVAVVAVPPSVVALTGLIGGAGHCSKGRMDFSVGTAAFLDTTTGVLD